MKKEIKLSFIRHLKDSIQSHPDLIQVVIGPRQVGKTTGISQFTGGLPKTASLYVSADGEVSRSSAWLESQWIEAKSSKKTQLLIIDEIQKVENWSETVKKLWDRNSQSDNPLKLILLGSSSLGIQKGLSESLTGRFYLHRVHHWNHPESHKAYGLDLEQFIRFGGYPGSYRFIDKPVDWLNYLRESIIETVIGRDILKIARVKSPALFRQSFDIACSYGGQEISYNKLLGQIQDKGNVDLVKHYLELFEGAFLIKQLFKYSAKKVITRSSSPKILPLCPALYTVTLDGELNSDERGRAFEILVGAELVRLPGELCYWRSGKFEVDYIYSFGKKVFAIEVKSGRKKKLQGLSKFMEQFPKTEPLIITPENFREIIESLTQ